MKSRVSSGVEQKRSGDENEQVLREVSWKKKVREMGCLARVQDEDLSQHGGSVPKCQPEALSLLLVPLSCSSKVLLLLPWRPHGVFVLGKDVCFVNMPPCRLVYGFNISILWENETLMLFTAVFLGQHLQVPWILVYKNAWPSLVYKN